MIRAKVGRCVLNPRSGYETGKPPVTGTITYDTGMTKNMKAIDEATGEVWDLTKAEPPKRGKKPGKVVGFTQLWVTELLSDHRQDLTALDMLVFMSIAHRMDRNDGITTYVLGDLASELGIPHTPTVSRAISRLIDAGLLRRRVRSSVWVNPDYAWKGNGGDRQVAQWRWHHQSDPGA